MDYSSSLPVTELATRSGFPAAEELRMVRALTQTAWLEARQHGVYRAAFRGFLIEAVRWPVLRGYGVSVGVTYAGAPYARTVLVVIHRAHGYRAWIAAERRTCREARFWESLATARVI